MRVRLLAARERARTLGAAFAVAAAALGAYGSARLYAQTSPAQPARAYAITNAAIVPVVGQPIPRGTVIIRDGRIAAVGANVPVPADATVIEASGLSVYPGMIDSGTQLGITEIASVAGGEDRTELGDFNPENVTLTAVNPHSELIPTVRVNGVTTVVTAMSGSQVSGQAALIDLVGWTPDEMAVVPRAGMVMTYPRLGGGGFGGFGGFGQQPNISEQRQRVERETRALRQFLADAKAYAETSARLAAGGRGRLESNLALEAMIPVMRGEMPAVFDVETAEQIRGVLQLADSFGLRVVLRGAGEAWRLADTLAARRVPVIVGPVTQTPGPNDPYDMIYANPGVLARAGVLVAFRTGSAGDSRNLPYNAALASAYGLDADEALRAVTINPARIWGVADRMGSIEVGKVATLIVTSGNPLDVRSVVRHLFIRGQPVPFDDRHTRLYERFRARPRP
jgi:imidazolonepropionase-like amidohydrolase